MIKSESGRAVNQADKQAALGVQSLSDHAMGAVAG